ncbi:hypothetical protein AB0B56_10125 [Streptosporangium canum]|uniref:hypothetical protein n=1 Tax=Streptosporangium canum TaxID=324952 RepID=UPI003433283D
MSITDVDRYWIATGAPPIVEKGAPRVAGVITRCSFLLAAVLAGSLLVPSPALAGKSSVLRSPDPLKAALLSPEDLGSDFTRRGFRTSGLLNPTFARVKKCGTAVKSIAAVYRAKAATGLKHKDRWEGISEYIVSGTAGEISALERAAKAMVRHCRKITVKTDGSKDIIRKLSIGRLGDSVHGIKFRSGFPDSDLERDAELSTGMMVAIDVVIIRVGNTMIALEHDGNVGEFDPSLTKSAVQTAVTRLHRSLQDN